MAYKQISPQVVAEGGTGAATLTGVLTGNGTSAFTASAVTDNTVVMGSTSNLLQDTTITVTDSGEMVNASQPAFLGILASTQTNKTGAGAVYVLGTDALTEIFDQGGDFNTNGTFTAPVTGKYFLQALVAYTGATAVAHTYEIYIDASNRESAHKVDIPADSGLYFIGNSILMDMDASDTAVVNLVAVGEASDLIDILGLPTDPNTWFCGNLQC